MNILTGVSSLHKWIDALSQHLMAQSATLSCSEQTGEIYVIWHIVSTLLAWVLKGT